MEKSDPPVGFPSGGGLYNPVCKEIRDSQMTPSKAWEMLSHAPSAATRAHVHHTCGSRTRQSDSAMSGDCGTLVAEQDATGGLTTQSGNFSSSISRAYAAVAKSRAGRRLGGLTMPGHVHISSDGSSSGDDSSSSDEQRS